MRPAVRNCLVVVLIVLLDAATYSFQAAVRPAPATDAATAVLIQNLTAEVTELKRQHEKLMEKHDAMDAKLDIMLNVSYVMRSSLHQVCVRLCRLDHNIDCGILVQQHFANIDRLFNADWNEFKIGFGEVTGNYWIGNDRLHQLTQDGRCKLRVDLQAQQNSQWYWAEYSKFIVEHENYDYMLRIGGYSGNAGDSMATETNSLNGMRFSTGNRDMDNWYDGNCAASRYASDGGFWFNQCGRVYINGSPRSSFGFSWFDLPLDKTFQSKQLLVSRLTLLDC